MSRQKITKQEAEWLAGRLVELADQRDDVAVKLSAIVRKAMLEHEPGSEAYENLSRTLDLIYEMKKPGGVPQ